MAVSILTSSLKAQEDDLLNQLRLEVSEHQERQLEIPQAFASEREMRQEVDQFLSEAATLVEQIKKTQGSTRNLYIMDELLARFARLGSRLFLSSSVVSTPSLRKAAEREGLRIEEFWIDDFLTDEDLYIELRKNEVAKKKLNEEEAAHLEHLLMYFRFYHADEDEEEELRGKTEAEKKVIRAENKQKLQNLSKTADKVATEFDRNVDETKKIIFFKEDELKGVPQWFLNETRTSEGLHQVEVHVWWQYDIVMRSAMRANSRRRLEKARDSIAQDINITLMESLLTTRQALAYEMGLESWLEHQLVSLSLDNETDLRRFVDSALEGNKQAFRAEQAIIRKWKKKQTGSKQVKIFSWDWRYYLAKDLEATFGFSDDESRQYFVYERVLNGVLRQIEKTFSLAFDEIATPEGWPDSTEAYQVTSLKTGKIIGALLLDPFPREGKDGWFFNMGLVPRRQTLDAKAQLPVTYVNLNFAPPKEDRPSLMSLWDVVTFLHEMGHALHDILTEVQFSSISGTSSYEDLVETPSAFLELWAGDADFMRSISGHHQTGAKLPQHWYENWGEILHRGSAHELQKRLAMASVDIELHGKGLEVEHAVDRANRLVKKLFYAPPPGTEPIASNTYISSGYDGLVWIYPFGSFLAQAFGDRYGSDIFDPQVSDTFVSEVLSVGGLRPTSKIARNFLGKKFDACAAALKASQASTTDR